MFPLFQSLDNISVQSVFEVHNWHRRRLSYLVPGLSLVWEPEDKKISEMEGRNCSGELFLITTRPKWTFDPRDLHSNCLWYPLLYNTISQLIVTPTASQVKQYSTCFRAELVLSWAWLHVFQFARITLKINLLKNAFLFGANSFVQPNWLVTENRGVTAKLVMLAEWGRWHGCCHYMLPCNFPTSCFLDTNRKSVIA